MQSTRSHVVLFHSTVDSIQIIGVCGAVNLHAYIIIVNCINHRFSIFIYTEEAIYCSSTLTPKQDSVCIHVHLPEKYNSTSVIKDLQLIQRRLFKDGFPIT